MNDRPHVDPDTDDLERQTSGGFDQSVAPHPAALFQAREELRSQLELWHLTEDDIDDILLIHSELVTNAMQQRTGHPITVSVRKRSAGERPEEIELVVTNRDSVDRVPHPSLWHPSGLLAKTGRGLLIVASLSDRVEVSQNDSHVAVTSWYRRA